MLDLLLYEFNLKDVKSIYFGNHHNLYPQTEELDKIKDNNLKLEIIAHNSNYYYFCNVLNIAILFRKQTFYLPTFFDSA